MNHARHALLALALTGCPKPDPEPGRVDAPAAGVKLDLRRADAAKPAELAVGDRFSISLEGTPTAGYLWAAESVPACLKAVEGATGPTTEAQATGGAVGGNHWEVLVFEVTAKCEETLTLAQRRPWEKDVPPADTVTFHVIAR